MHEQQRHVEQVIVLTHDVQRAGARGPCGQVALEATLTYFGDIVAGSTEMHCRACHKPLTLDDVSGGESYTPVYRDPRAH